MSYWEIEIWDFQHIPLFELSCWRDWGIELKNPRLVFGFLFLPMEKMLQWREFRFRLSCASCRLEVDWLRSLKCLREKHMSLWVLKWYERVGNPEFGRLEAFAGSRSESQWWVWNAESKEKIREEANELEYSAGVLISVPKNWMELWLPQKE